MGTIENLQARSALQEDDVVVSGDVRSSVSRALDDSSTSIKPLARWLISRIDMPKPGKRRVLLGPFQHRKRQYRRAGGEIEDAIVSGRHGQARSGLTPTWGGGKTGKPSV